MWNRCLTCFEKFTSIWKFFKPRNSGGSVPSNYQQKITLKFLMWKGYTMQCWKFLLVRSKFSAQKMFRTFKKKYVTMCTDVEFHLFTIFVFIIVIVYNFREKLELERFLLKTVVLLLLRNTQGEPSVRHKSSFSCSLLFKIMFENDRTELDLHFYAT